MMAECLRQALTDALDGWGEIATRVSRRLGVEFSPDAARRASSRTDDPLPVRRWGVGRARVLASGVEVDAWADRQWGLS